jgi:hypothetical protein
VTSAARAPRERALAPAVGGLYAVLATAQVASLIFGPLTEQAAMAPVSGLPRALGARTGGRP